MKINYRIISVNEAEHSIVVRYYTDTITEDMLAVSLDHHNEIIRTAEGYPETCRSDYHINIWEFPANSVNVMQMITRGAPVDWFRLQEAIANNEIDTSMSELKPFVKTANSFVINI